MLTNTHCCLKSFVMLGKVLDTADLAVQGPWTWNHSSILLKFLNMIMTTGFIPKWLLKFSFEVWFSLFSSVGEKEFSLWSGFPLFLCFLLLVAVMYRGKPQGRGIPVHKAMGLISLFICEDVDRDNHSDFHCMEYHCSSIMPSCHCLLTKSTFHFSTLSSPLYQNAKLPSSLVHIWRFHFVKSTLL